MDNFDRFLLFILGICVVLVSSVTLANPDGYYMQTVEGIIFTLFIGSVGLTMVLISFFSIFFKEQGLEFTPFFGGYVHMPWGFL